MRVNYLDMGVNSITRSGFIAIAGQPNVGKSTLLNGVLKEKVAIISRKPETTRDNIKGILTEGGCQMVFTDTPGIHRPHDLLGKMMLIRAQSTLLESDIILLMTEKKTAFDREDLNIISRLPEPGRGKSVFLIINKTDRVKQKELLLPVIKKAGTVYPFDEIIPMCALNPGHLKKLIGIIKKYLPEGPFYYPEGQLTDKSERFMIEEIIREKVLLTVHEEVPHSVAVSVEQMVEEEEKTLKIYATVFVERTSQKAILIGKKGASMKRIGELARADIEKMLSRHVYLDLWVKVFERWKRDPRAMREMGYAD